DLDAIPIKEETHLPYTSAVTVKSDTGATVSVMHACGHDIHMVSWLGAATLLAQSKNRWHGTLVFVGQPAEELLNSRERASRSAARRLAGRRSASERPGRTPPSRRGGGVFSPPAPLPPPPPWT